MIEYIDDEIFNLNGNEEETSEEIIKEIDKFDELINSL